MASSSFQSVPHYVVIGIDFGTTFSGVSWTWSQATNPDQIERVHNWDVGMGNGRNQQADKVPSTICYDDQGNVLKWGYMVSPQDRNQAAWFKLLLSDEARQQGCDRISATLSLLKRLGKSPVDVVADYLRCLWTHAVKNIELALVKIAVDNMTFRVVLTLPANWDHNAQELTRQAAVKAGITRPRWRGPTIFKTVSEPEAAALAAWRESGMRWRPDLKLNDSFVVCDAGGGTVDLISYTVTSLDPLKLEECVEPTGDLCGAVYLDEGFDRTIRTIVGAPIYDKLDKEVRAKVFENDWEFQDKRKYNGPQNKPNEFNVDIPGYKPKKTKIFGKRPSSTIILNSGFMDAIYQPVVGKIVDLVRTQVLEVQDKTFKLPKAVLLVGGFGENNFVLNQLVSTFPRVPIQRPINAWGAISRGAVIKGLSTSTTTETVTNFISKLSYGVKHETFFDPKKHQAQDKFRCPLTNRYMARDQFRWYLKRGESVSKMSPVQYSWIHKLRSPWQIENVHGEIWVSGLKTPPTRRSPDARKLCDIRCNFDASIFYELERKQAVDGVTEYRELDYTLVMKVAAGELDWVINWRGQQRGREQFTVEYDGMSAT